MATVETIGMKSKFYFDPWFLKEAEIQELAGSMTGCSGCCDWDISQILHQNRDNLRSLIPAKESRIVTINALILPHCIGCFLFYF